MNFTANEQYIFARQKPCFSDTRRMMCKLKGSLHPPFWTHHPKDICFIYRLKLRRNSICGVLNQLLFTFSYLLRDLVPGLKALALGTELLIHDKPLIVIACPDPYMLFGDLFAVFLYRCLGKIE